MYPLRGRVSVATKRERGVVVEGYVRLEDGDERGRCDSKEEAV